MSGPTTVSLRALAVVVAVATMATLLPVTVAEAVPVRRHSAERVLGGITTERLEFRTSGGTARGDLLRFREDDPAVDLRPRLARNTVAGTEGMGPMARRELGRGAVAGVNGGYWLSRPWGAPNGLFVDRGQLLAGQAVRSSVGGGPAGRGMVGWQRNSRPVMDLLTVTLTLTQPTWGTPPVAIDEVNRQPLTAVGVDPRGGELLLFTDRFGTVVQIPDDSFLIALEGVRLGSSGTVTGTVLSARAIDGATTTTVPEGQQLLLAYDRRRADVVLPAPGEELQITTSIAPATTDPGSWEGLWGGVAGGQLLVQDGRRGSVNDWRQAAAFSDIHVTSPQPRTVIARHRDGEVWLLTSDGRRPGWSVGITLRELADGLVGLGITEAVNLDGGGSTTMTVGGSIRNRPSEVGRSVADGLFLYVAEPPAARTLDSACTPEVQLIGTGFLDIAGTTHAASISCLSGWAVTTGVTATTFAPGGQVTREQMASFLARWIDDHAERGNGGALPDAGAVTFADVTDANVHADAIARLAAAGIVSGRSSDRFHPRESVTRAQTATMVTQAVEVVRGAPLPAGRDTFVDDTRSVHESNIDRLAGAGIVTGVGGFDFGPDAAVTRGAMASLLMRATALLVDEAVAVLPGQEPVLTGEAAEEDAEADDGAPAADDGAPAADEGDAEGDGEVDGEVDDGAPAADDGGPTEGSSGGSGSEAEPSGSAGDASDPGEQSGDDATDGDGQGGDADAAFGDTG